MQKNLERYPIAIPFKRYHDLEGKIAEYNIEFRVNDSELQKLIDFISLPAVERVNIHFTNGAIPIQIIQTANKVKDCVYVRLSEEQWASIPKLKEEGIRYFMDVTAPVCSFSELEFFIGLGVTDVYIADDLVYNMADVENYCHKNDVKIRTILNRIPLTPFDKGRNVKSLIYRPQDTIPLMEYIDTFEFDCGDPYDWHIFNVLFKAYFVNGYWHGDLMELNPDIQLEQGFPNDSIVPEYTGYKVNCDRKCNKHSPCRKCEQFYDIGIYIRDKGGYFKHEKRDVLSGN